MVQNYRRFSSLQNSFSVRISHSSTTRGDDIPKEAPGTPPAGGPGTRQRSTTILPRFIEVVVVGRAEQLKGWVSCENDLKHIPYFKALLEELMHGKITNIKLPGEDPGAFAQALYFARTRTLHNDYASLCKHNNTANPNGKIFYSKSGEIVKTIAPAGKFKMEELENAACDILRKALAYIHLTSSHVSFIVDHCDRSDPLYRLSTQLLAVYINHTGWSKWRVENCGWYHPFCDSRPSNAEVVRSALTTYKDCDYPTTAEGVCLWHIHTTTTSKVGPEADVADMKIEPEAHEMDLFEWFNGSIDERPFDSDESIDRVESLEDLAA